MSAAEVQVKRPMVQMCQRVIAVVDATKWGREGLASFADLSALDMVITDTLAPVGMVSQVQNLGVDVRVV